MWQIINFILKTITFADDMRKKYEYYIDVTKLRTRIINYQIKKYGIQLDTKIDRIDNQKASRQSKDRKNYRKNGRRK